MFSKYQRQKVVSLLMATAVLAMPNLAVAETFEEALISVYNSNPRLMAERARLRETDEAYIQARAQGRFTASAGGSLGLEANRSKGAFTQGLAINRDGTPSAAQVQIIQPLYQGGRVKALKRQAKAGILAARESLRSSEQNLLLSAANAYVDVLRDEEAARIRRNNVSVLARQELAAKDRFDVGVGTLTDIAQSQSRLAASEAGLAQADAQLQSSRAVYTRLVGHPPVALSTPPRIVLPPSLSAAKALAKQHNPQLLASQFNQDAAKAAIDVAKSASKPVVALNGTLGGQRGQINGVSQGDQASLTAQVTIPIFSGGMNRSRLRQARQAEVRTEFETRDAERAIDQSIAQLWAQLDAAKAILIASQKQVTAAQTAFDGVELEQSVGTRTTLDVLDAEQEVLNAKLAVTDAARNVNLAKFQLLTTIGVFDAEGLRLTVDNYDPKANLERIKSDGLIEITHKIVPESLKELISPKN